MSKPDKPRPPKAERPVAEDAEDQQFLAAMRQLEVRPAGARQVAPAKPPRPPRRPPSAKASSAEDRGNHGNRGDREDQQFLAAMQDLGAVPDKDRRRPPPSRGGLRRLRPAKLRQLPIEDRLDLHGRRVEAALAAVQAFVATAARRRLRAVLVITGKGLHSPTGAGVLKRAVEQWIERRGRDWVAGYGEAPREAGGRGAFVLELKRPRRQE